MSALVLEVEQGGDALPTLEEVASWQDRYDRGTLSAGEAFSLIGRLFDSYNALSFTLMSVKVLLDVEDLSPAERWRVLVNHVAPKLDALGFPG